MYDKATLKKFILNCHKDLLQSQDTEPADTDDFFNLETVPDTDVTDRMNFENNILLTELEATIDKVGTDKEFYIFYMLVKGKSYQEVGRIFDVTNERVRQIFDKLLDKIIYR